MIITPNTQRNCVHCTIAFLMPLCFVFEFFMKSFFTLKLKLTHQRNINDNSPIHVEKYLAKEHEHKGSIDRSI